jgi:tetratricopeptide (TPR) repeat protein
MKARGIFLVTFFACQVTLAQKGTDSLIAQLDSTISDRQLYIDQKVDRINTHKQRLERVNDDAAYGVITDIYYEYKSFVYDSAAVYAAQLRDLANRLDDPVKIADSKIKMAFILVSSGFLNEALDTLQTVRLKGMPDEIKIQYYYLMVRTGYDLAGFSQNHYYGSRYAEFARAYVDSASALMPPRSVEYLIVNGLKDLHLGNISDAKAYYEALVFNYELNDQQFAIAASTLSFLYMVEGDVASSKNMLVKAAIADIQSCTKEAIALVKLADLLYKEGDIEKASQYIRLAMEDAEFYGARYRKQQVASVFPIIEGERLSREKAKRQMLLLYSMVITASVVVFIVFFSVIKRKNSKLEKAQQKISRANTQLEESNKIKEEYLWYFFNIIAEYIGKLDALKTTIANKLLSKKIDDLRQAAEYLDIKQERRKLFHNFDIVFLKLFPDFVNVFNSLLSPKHRIVMKDGQLLSVEMRIFALIRLGVHDHEKIAKILGYSLTTIYTYKTRIKAKAVVSSEVFDQTIANIPAL